MAQSTFVIVTLMLSVIQVAGAAVGSNHTQIQNVQIGAMLQTVAGFKKEPEIPGPHQVLVTMRDGVKLHTVYTLPGVETKKYSTVIDRSPYSETGTELVADAFVPFGFAAVGQDFRGTYLSGGTFDLWRHSYNDTYDTIQWILKQEWSNGEIHIAGGSADGIAALVMGSQPALKEIKSQFIIWATAKPYLDVYPGGAYRYELIHNWLRETIKHTNYELLEEEAQRHESPADPWWDVMTPKPNVAQVPTVFWAGWYDIFLNGNLAAFDLWQEATNGQSWLIIDPLGHCQGAHANFPHAGIEGRVALGVLLGISMFKGDLNNLKPEDVPEGVKRLSFFVMGANHSGAAGNYWTTMDTWPTPKPLNMYMGAGAKLVRTPDSPPLADTFDFDPTNPVPTVGGNNLIAKCGPLDQTHVESRKDILLYTSDVLEQPLAIVGNITAELYVESANVNDTDWTVKLTDVYPDGASKLIQDGIIRMRWRKMGPNPDPITPNQIERVKVSLWATAYVFDKGHKLRVAVSSSNFPRFSTNPNTGLPLSMNSSTTKVASNTLHLWKEYPSHITLPEVSLDQLPKHIVV